MKKKPTLRELQNKYNPLYISQPKPKSINLFGCIALNQSIEVVLHPYLHHKR